MPFGETVSILLFRSEPRRKIVAWQSRLSRCFRWAHCIRCVRPSPFKHSQRNFHTIWPGFRHELFMDGMKGETAVCHPIRKIFEEHIKDKADATIDQERSRPTDSINVACKALVLAFLHLLENDPGGVAVNPVTNPDLRDG